MADDPVPAAPPPQEAQPAPVTAPEHVGDTQLAPQSQPAPATPEPFIHPSLGLHVVRGSDEPERLEAISQIEKRG